jgi:aspartyl-tRNA(Asn)/glutamyl-tRNA(Gln) amidotransferase subunit B
MKYLPTIGIETHVQLKTKTKLFAAVGNDAREALPNTLISHICVGLPGALPVLNAEAINLCVRAAFALNTKPQAFSKFERKHYFYPDLPKGYQITQYEDPIIAGGYVEFVVDGDKKRVNIERANLEEDAGKTSHPLGADYSLVDLNRAGTPLLEIVSKPEIHSSAEAMAFARELYILMKNAGITDGDLYHGHMRFDVNVSLSKDKTMGVRSETKNLNSFRSVGAAVDYEIKRQAELLDKGQKIIQETRGWDEAKQKTISQRGKEEAEDYRYMPEPDIPPIELDEKFMKRIMGEMPKQPSELRQELQSSGLSAEQIESILDDSTLTGNYSKAIEQIKDPKTLKAWSQGIINNRKVREALKTALSEETMQSTITAAKAAAAGRMNSNQFSQSLEEIIIGGKNFKELNIEQVSDESEIDKIIQQVLKTNPKVVADIKAGQDKAIGFLVGQVMAQSKGRANPQIAQKLIKKHLGV